MAVACHELDYYVIYHKIIGNIQLYNSSVKLYDYRKYLSIGYLK